MTGFKGYDDWKLETPEDERFRYGDTGELIEPEEDEPTELDLAYDDLAKSQEECSQLRGDLHCAQELIAGMLTVLKFADMVLVGNGATDEWEIIKVVRAAIAKAEASK